MEGGKEEELEQSFLKWFEDAKADTATKSTSAKSSRKSIKDKDKAKVFALADGDDEVGNHGKSRWSKERRNTRHREPKSKINK